MPHPNRRASDSMTAPWLSPDTPWYVQTGLFVLFWLGPAAIISA